MSTSDGLGRHRALPAKEGETAMARFSDRGTILDPEDPCRHNPDRKAGECGLCSRTRADAIEAVLRTNISAEYRPTQFNWVGLLAMTISALIVGGCLYGTISAILDRLQG